VLFYGQRGFWLSVRGRRGKRLTMKIVGLGGSTSVPSSSFRCLEFALLAAKGHGVETLAVHVGELALPQYVHEAPVPDAAHKLAEAVASADAMIWSSPLYHGSVSGLFKNAIDWLEVLGHRDPPYLGGKPIGLIGVAGGGQGLQAINSMEYIVRALRGFTVPFVVPVAKGHKVFDEQGTLVDVATGKQLTNLGKEVVEAAKNYVRARQV
jgi:FMN reductase